MTLPLDQRTLTGVWNSAVAAVPDQPFLRWADGELSYRQFDERSNRIANSLAGHGVARSDKVAIMLRNSVEFLEAWFGTAKLGAVYVPINTDYRGGVLSHQLNLAQVTHIVVEAEFVPRLVELADELRHLAVVISVRRSGDQPRHDIGGMRHVDFESLHAGADTPPDGTAAIYTDPLAISYTSGTTGPSKGVLATHCHAITFAMDWCEACQFTSDDRLYSCLPMFHAIATWLGTIPAILNRTSIAFGDRFSASSFWDDVRKYDATVVHGIFAIIPILLKQPERADDKDVPARLLYIGQRSEEFERRFGCRIVEVYGATETGIVTYTPLDEDGPMNSCGRPNNRTYEIALLDEHDNEVPVGHPGEICVRPHQPYSMFEGYFGMPAETVLAWRNLWFHTGDNALRDDRGYLYFVDRKKDSIRRRGENISSFELEAVLNADPRVLECAAVAHPSELGEDEVRMVIVRQSGASFTAADVWALCEARMPRFWIPRFVEFRDALPKTPNGKVQKYLLRQSADGAAMSDRLAAAEADR